MIFTSFHLTRFPHSICKPGCMFGGTQLLFIRKFPVVKPCLTNYAHIVYAPRYVASSLVVLHSMHFRFRHTSMYVSHEINFMWYVKSRQEISRIVISRDFIRHFRYLGKENDKLRGGYSKIKSIQSDAWKRCHKNMLEKYQNFSKNILFNF